jgi:cobalt-zinc-cadmium efflux system outer membrane protein
MIPGTTLIVAALAALGASASVSQEGVTTLTVEQAVEQALAHNLSLLSERDNIKVADAAVLTASLRPNPVVTISASRPDQGLVDAGISPYEQIFRTDYVMERGGKRERRVDQAALAK